MNGPAADPIDPMAELRRIKADFRRLRILCALLFLMAGLALYQNFTTRFELLDRRGNLNVFDDVQMPRAILHAEELTSGLTLYDHENRDRAMFVASTGGSGLTLRDVNAAQRMIFRVNGAGSEIILTDPEQRVRFQLLVDAQTSSIKLFDEQGRTTFDTSAAAPSADRTHRAPTPSPSAP